MFKIGDKVKRNAKRHPNGSNAGAIWMKQKKIYIISGVANGSFIWGKGSIGYVVEGGPFVIWEGSLSKVGITMKREFVETRLP